jgi:hypothetical protein
MVVNNDDQELNEKLAVAKNMRRRSYGKECPPCDEAMGADYVQKMDYGKLTQWTTGDGKRFIPSGTTKSQLPAGVYEIHHSSCLGLYFEKIPVRTEGLIRFPQTNSEKVLKEIETFWDKEKTFEDFGIAYKRGIILWGPPGGGKTCCVNLIMKDVVDRNGIVVKFTNPGLFMEGMRVLREIQGDSPIVVLMEDIDSIVENFESTVLNILDGVESIRKVVFLATTNYPEVLGARIINRPSRFDKRFKIPYPNEESRMIYFKHLIGNRNIKIDLNKWVKDTENFSIAHLKELFVAVVILGDDYDDALKSLNSMKERISSEDDDEKAMGFHCGKI